MDYNQLMIVILLIFLSVLDLHSSDSDEDSIAQPSSSNLDTYKAKIPNPNGPCRHCRVKAGELLSYPQIVNNAAAAASLESLNHYEEGTSNYQENGGIFYVTSMFEIKTYLDINNLDNSTWFIFDIDYVLITPEDIFGRPNGQVICQKLLKESNNRDALIEKIMTSVRYEILDRGTLSLLDSIKTSGSLLLFLTRMALDMQCVNPLDWRSEQLNAFSISSNDKVEQEFHWDNGGGYKKGIIRAGKNTKGQAFHYYINNIKKIRPQKVYCVDNNNAYLRSIEHVCRDYGIKFYGFHLVSEQFRADIKPNPSAIKYQLTHLALNNVFISYAEALKVNSEDLSPELLKEDEETLHEKWIAFYNHGSVDAMQYILTRASEHNYMAQAYASFIYKKGGHSFDTNRDIASQYAMICARALRDGNIDEETLYIRAHMYKERIICSGQISPHVGSSLQATIGSSNVEKLTQDPTE